MRDIVRYYTREAGVRNLERESPRSAARWSRRCCSRSGDTTVTVTPKVLEKYLGVQRFRFGLADEHDQVGQVTGLAWTEVGGELLRIESALVPGKGKFTYTGQLGDVMQESIQAALTVVRSRAEALGIDPDFHQKNDLHIHVPEGATPKDGPSAPAWRCARPWSPR
jgi:ATP-dependent Lon protease